MQVATSDSATQGPGPRWNAFQYSRYWQFKEREAAWRAAGGRVASSQPPSAEEADEADSRQLRTGCVPFMDLLGSGVSFFNMTLGGPGRSQLRRSVGRGLQGFVEG